MTFAEMFIEPFRTMDTLEIIAQLVGGFGIIASVAAFQCKKHRSIVAFRTLNEALFTLQYFLLGAWTGGGTSIVGIARNLVMAKRVQEGKSTRLCILIFSAFFTLFGIIFWEGPISIVIIAAKILSTVAYGNKNTTVIRIMIMITSSTWLIYNFYVLSIAGILCEGFTLISLIIGTLRFDILPRLKKKNRSQAKQNAKSK